MDDPQSERGTRVSVVRCYKNALHYQSHHFLSHRSYPRGAEHVQLGGVVFLVRKTLSDDRDPYHAPTLTDEAATILPVGTPVHEVTGYATDQRLAAYRNDILHVYDRDEK